MEIKLLKNSAWTRKGNGNRVFFEHHKVHSFVTGICQAPSLSQTPLPAPGAAALTQKQPAERAGSTQGEAHLQTAREPGRNPQDAMSAFTWEISFTRAGMEGRNSFLRNTGSLCREAINKDWPAKFPGVLGISTGAKATRRDRGPHALAPWHVEWDILVTSLWRWLGPSLPYQDLDSLPFAGCLVCTTSFLHLQWSQSNLSYYSLSPSVSLLAPLFYPHGIHPPAPSVELSASPEPGCRGGSAASGFPQRNGKRVQCVQTGWISVPSPSERKKEKFARVGKKLSLLMLKFLMWITSQKPPIALE